MAIIVEDGTSKIDSEAYVDAADAVTWATARYGAADLFVAASTADQEMYLRRGAMYIETEYGTSYYGLKTDLDQAMAWPRYGVTDATGKAWEADTIPQAIINANIEAARLIADGIDPAEVVQFGIKREKVDVIETEYQDGFESGSQDPSRYPTVHGWVSIFLDATADDGNANIDHIVRS